MKFFKNLFRAPNVNIHCNLDHFRFSEINEATIPTFLNINEMKKVISIGDPHCNIGKRLNGFDAAPRIEVLVKIVGQGIAKAIQSNPNSIIRPRVIFHDIENIPVDLFQKLLLDPNLLRKLKTMNDPSQFRIRFFQELGMTAGAREVCMNVSGTVIVTR